MDYHPISEEDLNIPIIYPFCGGLDNFKFNKLCNILTTCFNNDHKLLQNQNLLQTIDALSVIKNNMLLTTLAPITKKSTNQTFVDESKRICFRKTFGTDIVEQINDLIIDDIKKFAQSPFISPDNIIFDPSHGDILYYTEGCFFGNHRDTISKPPKHIPRDEQHMYKMYSIIIGLDSNIKNQKNIYNGATKIYLPPLSYLLDYGHEYEYNKYDSVSSNLQKKMIPHIFTDSFFPKSFLVFPSNACPIVVLLPIKININYLLNWICG